MLLLDIPASCLLFVLVRTPTQPEALWSGCNRVNLQIKASFFSPFFSESPRPCFYRWFLNSAWDLEKSIPTFCFCLLTYRYWIWIKQTWGTYCVKKTSIPFPCDHRRNSINKESKCVIRMVCVFIFHIYKEITCIHIFIALSVYRRTVLKSCKNKQSLTWEQHSFRSNHLSDCSARSYFHMQPIKPFISQFILGNDV